MTIRAKYVHTNIVARDWKELARFYEEVLGCTPVGPERDLSGEWLQMVTGLEDAAIRGAHLRLPGCGDEGPTLEIFQYAREADPGHKAVNRPGLAHLAFSVEDVEEARDAVLRAGGGTVGEVVTLAIPGAGTVSLAYVADPEGNILELQKWLH
jgi:catechol 2,3-dioxygenase-like lactoylglutathione lyase family enzyme